MIDTIREVLGHIGRRIGTAFSAVLVTHDVPSDMAGELVVALGAVAGVTFDIVLSRYYRKQLKGAAKAAALVELRAQQQPGRL